MRMARDMCMLHVHAHVRVPVRVHVHAHVHAHGTRHADAACDACGCRASGRTRAARAPAVSSVAVRGLGSVAAAPRVGFGGGGYAAGTTEGACGLAWLAAAVLELYG
jgi:hypothetical protein